MDFCQCDTKLGIDACTDTIADTITDAITDASSYNSDPNTDFDDSNTNTDTVSNHPHADTDSNHSHTNTDTDTDADTVSNHSHTDTDSNDSNVNANTDPDTTGTRYNIRVGVGHQHGSGHRCFERVAGGGSKCVDCRRCWRSGCRCMCHRGCSLCSQPPHGALIRCQSQELGQCNDDAVKRRPRIAAFDDPISRFGCS